MSTKAAGSVDVENTCCKVLQLIENGDIEGANVAMKIFSSADLRRADVLVLRGRLAWMKNDETAAFAHFQAALALAPDSPEVHLWCAMLCMHQGKEGDALDHAQLVERLQPGNADMRALIGAVRHHQGDVSGAIAAFASALEVDAQNLNARRGIATAQFQKQDWHEAEYHYRCLLRQQPDQPEALAEFGASLLALGRQREAWDVFTRAISLAGRNVDVRRAYAVALFNAGHLADARVQFDECVSIRPDDPMMRVARANCDLIAHGHNLAAWGEYEWRKRLYPVHYSARTRHWNGESLPGERLLVYAEQGLGDALLFSRYIPKLERVSREIVVQVPRPLSRLMSATARNFGWGAIKWIESAHRIEPAKVAYDCEIPLLSLIHVCGYEVERTRSPYVDVDSELVHSWSEKLGSAQEGRLRVGLVWAGNPARWEDYLRSIPTEQLAPLQRAGHVEFVSLQMEAKSQYKETRLPVQAIDPTPDICDFADTAAIMRNLDLVLSIDTAAAHLAGALGIPCWVLLSKIPDWRWEMGGIEQPWYSTHRSFRVERQCEWLPLMERVAEELRTQSRESLARCRLAMPLT